MGILKTVEDRIGGTPLLDLTGLAPDFGGRILGKAELWNPSGSAKDRAALAMLRDGEARGLLGPGATVIEATSGNLGISLALLCGLRGLRCVIVIPRGMSPQRQALMRAYGAEVLLTPAENGMAGAVEAARALAERTPGSFLPDQFSNPANPGAHYRTTGPEIWADTEGSVDVLVAGVGTGGTLTGAGRFLRQKNPALETVAVEPEASPLLSQGWAGPHGIQGIGPNFVPGTLDRSLVDRVVTVTEDEAAAAAGLLARRLGILAGISAGAAVHAALTLARLPENRGKNLVTILPDTGCRYLE
ncbi:MAG: cysteine synthase A [Oscillospiraceae bacterium]|nr:cysteine synthase A [Oscillospiraceae bacterium]